MGGSECRGVLDGPGEVVVRVVAVLGQGARAVDGGDLPADLVIEDVGLDAGRILSAPQPPVGVVEVIGGAQREAVCTLQNTDEMTGGVESRGAHQSIGKREHRLAVGVVVLGERGAPGGIGGGKQPAQTVVEVGGGETGRRRDPARVDGLQQITRLVVDVLRHRLEAVHHTVTGGIDVRIGGGARDLAAEVVSRVGA